MIKASKIIHGFGAFAFFCAILLSILRGFVKIAVWEVIVVLITGAAFSVLAVWFYGFLKKRTETMSKKTINRIFWLIALSVLIIQIFCAFMLKCESVHDLKYVDSAARNFAVSWDKSVLCSELPERHQVYFARYPNNHALLIILSLIYYVTNSLFGTMPLIAPILINTLGLNLSFIMMYFIAKRIFPDKTTPLYTAILGALFCVFYTYTPYYYTDAMSMPFVMGSVLLFLKGTQNKKTIRSIILFVLSSFLAIIGYRIKGSVIILPVAYIAYSFYSSDKQNFKKRLLDIAVIILSSVVSVFVISSAINAFKIADESEKEKYEFPLTHWIMMGLHDRGGYCDKDFWYTENSGNYEEKMQANIDKIEERVSDFGVFGMIKHLAKKIGYTWDDGTYFIKQYIDHGSNNFLRSFVTKSPIFYLYALAYHFLMLVMIFVSYLGGVKDNTRNPVTLIRIIIFGVFLFFLIWEARSRYLVNFTPMLIISSAYGIKLVNSLARKIIHRRKHAGSDTNI